MSSSGLFSIGGLASGLDTNTIISQLMQLERQPVIRLQSRQAKLRTVDGAWGQVNSKISGIRAAVDKLAAAGGLADLRKVTSSNTDAVTVTRTGTPAAGTLQFTVDRLAKAQQSAATRSFSSADATLGSGSHVSILNADGSERARIAVTADMTLSELAKQLNAVDGVGAQVIKAAEGDYRLVLSAKTTGTANAFSVASDVTGFANFATDFTTTAAENAQVTTGGVTVTRSTNQITDLVDGVTINLQKLTIDPVSVTVTQDVDAAVAAVKGLVDAVNAAMGTIKSLSSYNETSKTGGPLNGDGSARSLVNQLRHVVSDTVANLTGTHTQVGSVGISIAKDGQLTLDETKLRAALEGDVGAVDKLFARAGSAANASLSYVTSTDKTVAGSYGISVTRAAQIAAVTGAAYQSPPTDPQVFVIKASDGTTVRIQIDVGETITSAVRKINDAAGSHGIKASAVTETLADGTTVEKIRLEERSYGSSYRFTVEPEDTTSTWDVWGLRGTHAGVDVAGTINGQAATGAGQTLTSTEGDSTGLAVNVTSTQAQVDGAGGTLDLGNVTVSTGVAGALSQMLAPWEGAEGHLERARKAVTSQIDLFAKRIEDFETRLGLRERQLKKKFAALETAMSKAQAQGQWLAGQLASLQAPRNG